MAFRGVRKKPQVVDDDGDVHNTSEGDRDRPGRIGWRLANRIREPRNGFGETPKPAGVTPALPSAPTPTRNAIQFSQKGQPTFWTMQPLKSRWERSWE